MKRIILQLNLPFNKEGQCRFFLKDFEGLIPLPIQTSILIRDTEVVYIYFLVTGYDFQEEEDKTLYTVLQPHDHFGRTDLAKVDEIVFALLKLGWIESISQS